MTNKDEKVVPLKKPAAKKTPPKKPAVAKKSAAAKKTPAKKPTQTLSKKAKEHLKAKQAEVDAAQVDAEHNSRLDLREKIKGYFGELRDLRKAITEMTGKMGSRVKTILQVEDWNRGAHADIQKILGMSEAKRADYLRTFDPLYRVLYEEEWKSELHDLLTQIEAEANPEANLSDVHGAFTVSKKASQSSTSLEKSCFITVLPVRMGRLKCGEVLETARRAYVSRRENNQSHHRP